jgi:hypothetical protein
MENHRAPSQEQTDDKDARAAMWVKAKCEIANMYVDRFSDPDPQERQRETAHYQRHRDEAIASALAIKDQFAQGLRNSSSNGVRHGEGDGGQFGMDASPLLRRTNHTDRRLGAHGAPYGVFADFCPWGR